LALVQTARADSDDDRIGRLEKRIRELEERLVRAEQKANVLAGAKAAAPAKAAAGKESPPNPPVSTNASAHVAATTNTRIEPQKQPARERTPSDAKESTSDQPPATNASAGAPESSDTQGDPQKQLVRDLTPSEFNVFRDNAATLARHNVEAAVGVAYQKRNSTLQSDRAVLTNFNLRYGLMDGVEVSLNVPYYYATRTTQVSPTNTYYDSQSGIGDISGQISALAIKETADWPALVATARLVAPTGQLPVTFNGAYLVSGNPIDPLISYQTTGNWIPGIAAQIYKTLDPVIVFAGVGLNLPLPQSVQGHYLQYSPQFTYNMGFAFSANEKTTFGIQVNGAFQGNFWVDGSLVQQSEQEPIVGRVVVVQRIARDTYIEPSFAFGLTKDAADAQIALTLRHRY